MNPLYPNQALALIDQPPVVLLAMCLFGEARGESSEVRCGVAQVVVNRARHTHPVFGSQRGLAFHENVARVIARPYQFSCFLPADVNYAKIFDPLSHEDPAIWNNCMEIASEFMQAEKIPDTLTNNSDHYFDQSIRPPTWAVPAKETVKLGRLRFFRLYLPALQTGIGSAAPSGNSQAASVPPSPPTSSPAAELAASEALPASLPAPPPPLFRDPRYGLTRWLGGRELSSLESVMNSGGAPDKPPSAGPNKDTAPRSLSKTEAGA